MIWEIETKPDCKIYRSDECKVTVFNRGEESDIYLDWKGYNIILIMEVWGFKNEAMGRDIFYTIQGESGRVKEWNYRIRNEDLRVFIDLIYFFIKEHDMTQALSDDFKINGL